MYNGIGLQTPRGSGTSGHIQKNLSNRPKPKHNKDDFLKTLQSLKDDLAPVRKANPEIVEHERKRQILICGIELRRKLEKEGKPKEQIDKAVEKAQKLLTDKLKKGQFDIMAKDSHLLTQAKEREYNRMRQAFGVSKDYKAGSAFDFETQEKEKFERMALKQEKFKYVCPHQQCQKRYEIEKEYHRHLKYKHPQTYQKIVNAHEKKAIQEVAKKQLQNQQKDQRKEGRREQRRQKKDERRQQRHSEREQRRQGRKEHRERRREKSKERKSRERSGSRDSGSQQKRSHSRQRRKNRKDRHHRHSSSKSRSRSRDRRSPKR